MESVAAAGVVQEAIVAAVQALLDGVKVDSGAAGVRASLTVYDGVAGDRPTPPYVVVGGSTTEDPFHTLGPADGPKWGGSVRVPLRVVTQYPTTEGQTWRILNLLKAGLDQRPLSVSGFASVDVTIERATLLTDTVAGTVTRELVTTCDVLAHQS